MRFISARLNYCVAIFCSSFWLFLFSCNDNSVAPSSKTNSAARSTKSDLECPIKWQSHEKITKLAKIDKDEFVDQIKDFSDALPNSDREKKIVALKTAILAKEYPPNSGLEIQGNKFYFSKSICGERPLSIMYSFYEHQWYSQLLYRSLSNGVWRSTQFIYPEGAYDKGAHYTQDMLPNPVVDAQLNYDEGGPCLTLSADKIEELRNKFKGAKRIEELNLITPTNVTSVDFKTEFNNYENGVGFINGQQDSREKFFASMEKDALPKDFFPNFLCLNKSYLRSHSLFSRTEGEEKLKNNIKVDVFLAKLNNHVIEWHFAYVEGEKLPWIARIRFADAPISSYGGDARIIDSKALTLKPLEYIRPNQIKYLVEGSDYSELSGTNYADIRKFLQNFPPIIAYKKYKDEHNSW
ncbi:MAG: hypothetical protein KC505_01370 [Myxococcales bacterium]|nr:hypothetical protein [Myxococcales bacterium]USN51408.1 MAG: hypothetical protein H6731_03085 [Myxococcales bacterium]